MTKGKIKFAVAGLGFVGRRHVNTIMNHPGCELVAMVDPLIGNYKGLPDVPRFSDLDECFGSPGSIDAVVIATPNGSHFNDTMKALQLGSHVLVEKPFALKKEHAIDMMDQAKKLKKLVMVVLQNRFSPVSQWLKNMTSQDLLGKIYFVEINCFWNRNDAYYANSTWRGTKEKDGGSLYTQFSHFIDSLYWLFGDIKNISSRFYNYGHPGLIEIEDTGSVNFDFVNGGSGCFNFTTAAFEKNTETSMTIIAEKGNIRVTGQYMDSIEFCNVRGHECPSLPVNDPERNHIDMLGSFLKAVDGKSESNAMEAMMSVDMIERMYQAKSN